MEKELGLMFKYMRSPRLAKFIIVKTRVAAADVLRQKGHERFHVSVFACACVRTSIMHRRASFLLMLSREKGRFPTESKLFYPEYSNHDVKDCPIQFVGTFTC